MVSESDAPAALLDAEEARSLMSSALMRPAGAAADSLDFEDLEEAPELVKSLPGWIGRYSVLAGAGVVLLWCEPRADFERGCAGQMVFDLPRVRYFVDVLDVEVGAWISRESAAGGPLVAGLPFTGHALLVHVLPADSPVCK